MWDTNVWIEVPSKYLDCSDMFWLFSEDSTRATQATKNNDRKQNNCYTYRLRAASAMSVPIFSSTPSILPSSLVILQPRYLQRKPTSRHQSIVNQEINSNISHILITFYLIRLYLAMVVLQFTVPDQGTTKLEIIRLGHLDLRSPGAFLARNWKQGRHQQVTWKEIHGI